MSDTIETFTLAIEERQLEDLRQRLAATRWPEPETVDDWSQGVPLKSIQALVEYWRTKLCAYRFTGRPSRVDLREAARMVGLHQ